MNWQPIETLPRDVVGISPIHCAVGWWVSFDGMAGWWETSTDELTACATHWVELPPPPERPKIYCSASGSSGRHHDQGIAQSR